MFTKYMQNSTNVVATLKAWKQNITFHSHDYFISALGKNCIQYNL